MAKEGGDVVGFEEGMSWLPSHVLHQILIMPHDFTSSSSLEHLGNQQRHNRHARQRRSKLPVEPPPPQSRKLNRGTRFPTTKWAFSAGGPGMQAIFLESGQRSCGTGVFLPQQASGNGTDIQSTHKLACSPVLLPARVVQALNLNVHSVGKHGTPQRDATSHANIGNERGLVSQKSNKREAYEVAPPDWSYYSPEVVLPKEWTY